MSPSFSLIRQCMLTLILSLSFACDLAISKPPYFTYRSLEPPETCVNPVKYNSFEEFDSYVIETLSCGINCRSYKPPTSQNVYELLAAISHLWEKPLPAESWTLSNGQGYESYTGLRITQLAKLFSRIETSYRFATHINSCQKNLVLKAIETSIDKPGFVQLSNAYRAIALGRLVSKIFFLSRILLQEPTIYDNPDKYESLFNLLDHWLIKYNQKTNYGYPDYEVVRQMTAMSVPLLDHASHKPNINRIRKSRLDQKFSYISTHMHCGTCSSQYAWILIDFYKMAGRYTLLFEDIKTGIRDSMELMVSGLHQRVTNRWVSNSCDFRSTGLLNCRFRSEYLNKVYPQDKQAEICNSLGDSPCAITYCEIQAHMKSLPDNCHCEKFPEESQCPPYIAQKEVRQ